MTAPHFVCANVSWRKHVICDAPEAIIVARLQGEAEMAIDEQLVG
jgi:hypothetical protein